MLTIRPVGNEISRITTAVAAAASVAQDGWVLVVDDEHKPEGWLAVGDARPGEIVPELLHRGGTLAPEGGSLRAALDAALSSPSGRGVIVNQDGRLIGSVTAAQVVERIYHQASESRPRTSATSASASASGSQSADLPRQSGPSRAEAHG